MAKSGRLSFQCAHPWWTLGIAVLVAATSIAGIVHFKLKTDNSIDVFLVEGDEEYERFQAFRRHFGSNEVLALGLRDAEILTVSALAKLATLEAKAREIDAALVSAGKVSAPVITEVRGLHSFPIVKRLIEGGRAPEIESLPLVAGTFYARRPSEKPIGVVLALLRTGLSGPERGSFMAEIEKHLASEKKVGNEVASAGSPSLNYNLDLASKKQSAQLFPYLFAVAIGVIWVLTRSLRAALWMASPILVTAPIAICFLVATGHSMNMITTTIPAVLMVLCFASSLHLYRAFVEEDPAGVSTPLAADRSRRHITGSCFLASLTTSLGFLSLASSSLGPIRQMGVFSSLGIMVGFVAAITVLPAMLALGVVPRRRSKKRDVSIVLPRPSLVLAIGAVVLLAVGFGATKLKIESAAIRFLPKSHEVVQAFDQLQRGGLGLASIEVVARSKNVTDVVSVSGAAAIARAQAAFEALPTITTSTGMPDVLGLIRKELVSTLSVPSAAEAAGSLLKGLDDVVPADVPAPDREGVALAPLVLPVLGQGELPPMLRMLPPAAMESARDLLSTHLKLEGQGAVARIHISSTATEVDEFHPVMAEVLRIKEELARALPGTTVEVTGLAPMLIRMQNYLIESQIWSLIGSGALMLVVLLIGLRSLRLSLIGALPNLAPVLLMFGIIGWLGLKLDIATVMVGAIALGIAVDDTVHLLASYDRRERRRLAVRKAISEVWWPVISVTIVTTAGFAVLGFSDFVPMRKFGLITAGAMILASLCDLLLTPALLLLFGPRPDQSEFLRITGAGGFVDRILRRKRGGRLLLDLGFSAWRGAERQAEKNAKAAGKLYSEAAQHFDRFLQEKEPSFTDPRRFRRHLAARYYRALSWQGLDRVASEDIASKKWLGLIRKELDGFEQYSKMAPEAVIPALGVRLRAEVKQEDYKAAERTLNTLESLSPRDNVTVRGHLRMATALLEAVKTTKADAAKPLLEAGYESYRRWVLRAKPAKPAHWLKVGVGLESLGHAKEAIAVYEAMLDHFAAKAPEGEPDLIYKMQRRLARLYIDLGDRKSAHAAYTQLVGDKVPANPYFASKDLRTKIELIEQGQKEIPDTEEFEI